MKKYKYLVAAVVAAVVLAAAFFAGGPLADDQTPEVGDQQTEISTGGTVETDTPETQPSAKEMPPSVTQSPAKAETPPAEQPPETTWEQPPEAKQEPQPSDTVPAVPEGGQTAEEQPLTCTISISCAALLERLEELDPEKTNLVPEDGWLLRPVSVEFRVGESVFDVLQRVCREQKLHMEFSNTPVYNSAYIEGIGNLYEFDCGALSGWMYCVNEWFPNYGCSSYALSNGDVIRWVYTCDLGADVGNDSMAGE